MTASNVYISTGAFKTPDLREIFRIAAAEGFDRLELSSGVRWSPLQLEEVRAAARSGMSFLIHNYFPTPEKPFVLNLASDEPTSLKLSRDHCRRAIDLCEEVGSPFYTVHSGFCFRAQPSQLGHAITGARLVGQESAQAIFVESLSQLCRYGRQRGVRIAIENNVLAPFNLIDGKNKLCLCATAEEIVATIAAVGEDNLGVLLDVAHAKVSANALGFDLEEFVSLVRPHLYAFHVSDNDGSSDSNDPVLPNSWFLPHLAANPRLPVSLESYKLDPGQIKACCEIIVAAQGPHS